jgi:hypothetical protein
MASRLDLSAFVKVVSFVLLQEKYQLFMGGGMFSKRYPLLEKDNYCCNGRYEERWFEYAWDKRKA